MWWRQISLPLCQALGMLEAPGVVPAGGDQEDPQPQPRNSGTHLSPRDSSSQACRASHLLKTSILMRWPLP